jgi:hypothetical protein
MTRIILGPGRGISRRAGILGERPRVASEFPDELAGAAERFEKRYRRAIRPLVTRRVPLTICTIYNGNFPDTTRTRSSRPRAEERRSRASAYHEAVRARCAHEIISGSIIFSTTFPPTTLT